MGQRVNELEARYDGRIPPGLLREAQIADRQVAHAALAGGKVGLVRQKPAGMVAIMARDMLLIRATREAVTQSDLIALGWKQSEIAQYAPAAAAMAAERAGMRAAVVGEAA